jgi:hypothetical protein
MTQKNTPIEHQELRRTTTPGARLLESKYAVVFGAGGSIGAAVAKEFAAEGAQVFLAGRTKARLDAVANQITAAGGEPQTNVVDALDDADVNRYLDGVAKQAGKIDIVVDLTGPLASEYGNGKVAVELPVDEFMASLTTIVRSHFITGSGCSSPHDQPEIRRDHFRDRKPCPATCSWCDRHRRRIRRDREPHWEFSFRGQPVRRPGSVPPNRSQHRQPIHSGHHGLRRWQNEHHQGAGDRTSSAFQFPESSGDCPRHRQCSGADRFRPRAHDDSNCGERERGRCSGLTFDQEFLDGGL